MATFFSGQAIGYWYYTSNTLSATLTGDISRSDNTVTLYNMRLSITSAQSSSGTDTFTFTVNGTSTSFTLNPSGTNFGTHSLNNTSFSVSSSATSKSVSWSSSDGYSGNFTVNFISNVSVSDVTPSTESFTATVSIAGWGGSGDASSRYRELQCWTYNSSSFVEPRRYQAVYGNTLSGSITVSNSSSGSLTITPNTRYTLGAYASNGTQNTSSQRIGNYVTLAPQDTLTVSAAHSSSLDIDYSVPADGGFYAKTLEYSIDGGTTWVAYDTISGGSATSGSFTISGLQANTTYTIKSRVTTTAGTTDNDDITGKTIGPDKAVMVSTLPCSVNEIVLTYKEPAFNSTTGRRLELYGGTSASPTTLIHTESNPSDNTEYTYTYSSLSSNTHYYFRARGFAQFNGVEVAGEYSDDRNGYTLAPQPIINSMTWVEFTTPSSQKYILDITTPADGGAFSKLLQYRTIIDGATSEWTDLTTVASASATALTADINITNNTATEYTGTLELRSRTTAGSSTSASTTFTLKAKAGAPTVSSWSLVDNNSAISTILGTDTTFVAGYSAPKLSVNESDITLAEGASISQIKGTFDGATQNLTLSGGIYSAIFSPPTQGNKTGTLYLKDNLDGEYTDSVSRTVLPYSKPTITGSYSYVSEDGKIGISIAGEFSPLVVGTDKNTLTVSYKVSSDTVLVDWTTVQVEKDGTNYTGYVNNVPTNYQETYLVELKIVDALGNQAQYSFEVSALDKERFLTTPQYDIEVWTRDGDFVADISKYLTTDLSITWKLNDVEELSFSISLDALELLRQNGASTIDLLTPYAHDIRVRRNGQYIVGCQVVEANIKIDNDQIPTVQIKATGFLNIFKDQYISEPMAGYTYPEMAHKLINRAQHADCLIKNPTGDIDASYWLSDTSSVAQTTVSYAGAGAIQASASSSPTTLGTQLNVKSGTSISVNVWVSGAIGTVNVYERELINQSSNQVLIGSLSLTSAGTYTQLVVNSYTTSFDNGYIYFSEAQTGTPLRVDNCFVSRIDDEDSLNNHYVGCIYSGLDDTTGGTGHNYATVGYTDREFSYELQNVKDAIMDLTQMGEDYFEFEFTPDRIFNTYDRKGSDRTDIEIMYPGNVHSMTVDRSAADMANKIQEIGSGIGDERLEVVASNTASRQLYGTRESVVTQNNVSLEETLEGLAQGELDNRGTLKPVISVQIQDGSINCGNIQTGDVLAVRIGDYLGVLGQQQNPQTRIYLELLGGVEGWYRVKQVNTRVAQDGGEALTLQLEYQGSFEES